MIAVEKVKETERLLAEGKLSQRKIAQTVGISRATVSAIALGERPDGDLTPSGPLERCPTCGGMVYMPCRLCHTRKMKQAHEEARRAARRRTREESAQRLLEAVRKARLDREAAIRAQLPDGSGASDCK